MQRDLPVPTSVWSYSWNGNTEAVEWTEIAVVHASAKYLWAFGYRYSKQRRKLCLRQELADTGSASAFDWACWGDTIYTEAAMQAARKDDEAVLTLADQAATGAKRMAEIRTVLAVVRDAEARCREIDGQLLPVGTAYLETADGPDKAARAADVDRIVAAHQQALEARSAAWERMQRYTVSEIERARESGSLV